MTITRIDGARQFKATGNISFLDAIDGTTKHKLVNLGEPTVASDGATKYYVDTSLYTLDIKASCRAATTGNITATYDNGTAGVGATLTGAGALAAQDGVTLVLNDRLLVKDQTDQTENGIYSLTTLSPFVLTRTVDADEGTTEVNAGNFTFIEEGTTQFDTGWALVTDNPIVIGTTNLVWEQFAGSGAAMDSDNFVIRDNPTGTINGTNTSFTLGNTPVTGKEEVYLNGLLQEPGGGNDYTISGAVITFVSPPVSGDRIRASYIID